MRNKWQNRYNKILKEGVSAGKCGEKKKNQKGQSRTGRIISTIHQNH
jgi:hypothetical protein